MSGLPEKRPFLGEVIREPALWALLAVVILFFARPLFFGETFFFRDLSLLAFPQRLRFAELVRTSGLPLWDPYLHGGQPFLGSPSNVALYPTALLYLVLSPVAAFNIEIVFHFLVCAFAGYWLARILGLDPPAAVVAGAVLTLCGFTLSLANLLNRLLAMPNTVFLILFWHLLLLERKGRWFAGAVVAGALVVFAGSVEFLFMTALIALAWAFCYPYPPGSWTAGRRAAAGCAVFAGILGVAAVQILPGLEVVEQSARGAGLDFRAVTRWSLHPRRLLELLLPGFLGPTDTLAESDYWGGGLEEGFPVMLSIFLGLPALALASTEGLSRADDALPGRFRRLLLAAAITATLLALGRFAWLTPSVYRAAPLLRIFRYPVKALFGAILPVALLAGAGASRLAGGDSGDGRGRGRRPRLLWIAAVLLGAAGAVIAGGGPLAARLERFLFLSDPGEKARAGIAVPFFHAAAAAGILALLLQARRSGPRPWLPAALAGLVVADLAVAGRSVNPYAPRSLLKDEPPIASVVRSGLDGGRFYREPTPQERAVVAPSNRIVWLTLLRRETLDYYAASAFGIPVIFHDDYDGLARRRSMRLTSIAARLPWESRLPILSAGNATVVMAAEKVSIAGLEHLGEVKGHSSLPFFVYRNSTAAPRVGFVTTSLFVQSESDAVKAILSRGFDARRHVVLEGRGSPVQAGGCSDGRVVELERSPVSWTGRVTAGCAGYLVFSEPDDPGWKGSLDGLPAELLRANVAFSAIAVPAGAHVVSRQYHPGSVALGAALSIASAAGTVAIAFMLAARLRA